MFCICFTNTSSLLLPLLLLKLQYRPQGLHCHVLGLKYSLSEHQICSSKGMDVDMYSCLPLWVGPVLNWQPSLLSQTSGTCSSPATLSAVQVAGEWIHEWITSNPSCQSLSGWKPERESDKENNNPKILLEAYQNRTDIFGQVVILL